MRLRFSIRDLLLITAIVALAFGWWLDHWEQVNRNQLFNGQPKFELYSITKTDSNVVLNVLKTMFAGTPMRFATDTRSNLLVVQATPSQHAMIRSLVDSLEGRSPTPSSTPSPGILQMRIPDAYYPHRTTPSDLIEQMPMVPHGDPH